MDVPSVIIFGLISLTHGYNQYEMVKVAIYEHNVTLPPLSIIPVSRAEAVDNMMVNLKVMEYQAKRASSQGARLLVLPEDGIYGFMFTRRTIYPYLEQIPDPTKPTAKPCPTSRAGSEVQCFLSRLAMETGMYIVANMGDKQPCNKNSDTNCPVDGHYQYNTNVIYDPSGKLIAKYHKYNLFYEPAFDVPNTPEIVTFETPFGTFGVFTCFDILFHDPPVELLQNKGVRNIVFPTAWFDALPHLSAVGFHSAFAAKWQINFLAANIHHPEKNAQGSGIYSIDRLTAYVYDNKDENGRLLVSNIPILKPNPKVNNSPLFGSNTSILKTNIGRLLVPNKSILKPNTKREESDLLLDLNNQIFQTSSDVQIQHMSVLNELKPKLEKNRFSESRHVPLENSKHDVSNGEFKAPVFHDIYDFVLLSGDYGHKKICQKDLCCNIVYNRIENKTDLYAFGAFDGLHTYQGSYYLQVCTLLRCKSTNYESCGVDTTDANTQFKYLEMTSTSNGYIYPEVMLSNGEMLELSSRWYVTKDGVLTVPNYLESPLLSASLISRIYSKDKV